MFRRLIVCSALLFAFACGGDDEIVKDEPTPKIGAAFEGRDLKLTYTITIPAQKESSGQIDIFLPMPLTDDRQFAKNFVDARIPAEERNENTYDNPFWHGTVDKGDEQPIVVTLTSSVTRRAFEAGVTSKVTPLTAAEKKRYLAANTKVPIDSDLVKSALAELQERGAGTTPVEKAQALYDYAIETMEYKKEGDGWGNGDTHWACTKKYGNCTDYHALIISLARAQGIPARFSIGMLIPEGELAGQVEGYHCWVDLYLEGKGWFPLDASEADLHPEKKDALFGKQAADRVAFSVGRDLNLGKGHTSGALNYFIDPHVEIGGKVFEGYERAWKFVEM